MIKFFIIAIFFAAHQSFGASFAQDLVAAAIERTNHDVTYNGAYFKIDYPNGDVPENIGVCTDVVIRAYRAIGTDLQVLVHEDMAKHFSAYPSHRIWGLSRSVKNIDHRLVPNLLTFFDLHWAYFSFSIILHAYWACV